MMWWSLLNKRSTMQESSHSSSGGVISREGSSKRFPIDVEAGAHRRLRGSMPPVLASRSVDFSDSNSASHQSIKHAFHSKGVRNFRYKGVVIQPNGHWGAQIYANHKRVWLGTYKSETEAAKAYDSAAIKLRDSETHRNFPWTEYSLQETEFQSQFSASAVLNMIKDGSYNRQFSEFLKSQTQKRLNISVVRGNNGLRMRQLFQKELTPSDVSKLNRLVIPKKYAVQHFPPIPESENENEVTVAEVELVFYDREMTSWTFRYCYWKSSQSFVFTRGWNKFTKKKGLKPKDRVVLFAYDNGNRLGDARRMLFIDVTYNQRVPVGGTAAVNYAVESAQRPVIHRPFHSGNGNGVRTMDVENDDGEVNDDEVTCGGVDMDGNVGNVLNGEKKGVMLFGVRIA